MPSTAIPAVLPPCDGLTRAWIGDPLCPTTPLVIGDWLEEQAHPLTPLFRELVAAQRKIRRAAPPVLWEPEIERLPPEWRSVFAAGCVARCSLWLKDRTVAVEICRQLIEGLTVAPFSEEASKLPIAALGKTWLREVASLALDYFSSSRKKRDDSLNAANLARYRTVLSRAYTIWGRTGIWRPSAAWSRARNTEERWQAYWLRAMQAVLGV